MFDINLVREKPELVKKNLKNRYDKEMIPVVDDLLKKDAEWKKLKQESDALRAKRNQLSKKINELKKKGKKADKEIKAAAEIPDKIKEIEEVMKNLKWGIKKYLMNLPNMLDPSVPIGVDEKDNKELKKVGKPKKFTFEIKGHGELAEELGLADFKRSAKVSGAGFYYIKNELAILNQALIRYTIDFLIKKGFDYIEPPLMLRKAAYEGVVELDDFENVMYKAEKEDLYFIATSEHSLIAQYMDENIPIDKLPLKLAGYSMCFRKEIGSHGVDTKGLFRTHQFNKIEQIVICKPKEDMLFFNEILKNSAELVKNLGLPFRLLEMCSGDLGNLKSKQIDVEVWMPKQGTYQEVGSCSNCTDYQAKRLNMKAIDKKLVKTNVHTLNNTAIATSRIMVAILENFQNKDGSVDIPTVLHKYTGFKKIKPVKKTKK
ncbi:serine--tRNA ligase [Candidatus Woesearchaeota archaeon]|nr:serine--tRNA ligase [Candidatus Woesearchaeota archaeon]MBW3005913.1 serine--tRNA ligase [Candidatus Woesearchaeota archaeon]